MSILSYLGIYRYKVILIKSFITLSVWQIMKVYRISTTQVMFVYCSPLAVISDTRTIEANVCHSERGTSCIKSVWFMFITFVPDEQYIQKNAIIKTNIWSLRGWYKISPRCCVTPATPLWSWPVIDRNTCVLWLSRLTCLRESLGVS